MNVPLGISGYYDLSLRNPKDGLMYPLGRVHNLITNAGMDAPARWAWARCFEVIAVGTGTAAALPTDIKLQTFLARSKTYASGASGVNYPNKASNDYSVRELYRTFVAYQNRSGSAKQVNEIGVSWEDVDNPDLFSRVALASPVSVPDGFDLLVRYTLRFQFEAAMFEVWKPLTLTIGSQTVSGSVAHSIGTSAYTSDGLFAMSYVGANGVSAAVVTSGVDIGRAYQWQSLLEPSVSGPSLYAGIDEQALTSATTPDDTRNIVTGTLQPYTAGSYSRVKRFTFPAAMLPGRTDLRTICVGMGNGTSMSTASNDYSHQVRFVSDAAFTKPSTVQWDVDFTLTWERAA